MQQNPPLQQRGRVQFMQQNPQNPNMQPIMQHMTARSDGSFGSLPDEDAPDIHSLSLRKQSVAFSMQGESRFGSAEVGGFFTSFLTFLSYMMMAILLPLSLIFCLRVVKEYERVVIFRLGRLLPGGAKGPGLFFILPCIDTYRQIDLRVVSFDVPPQEILSKDSVTVSVDAVVYFRTSNPIISVTNVSDAFYSTKLLAQTTLRNILGTKTLAEMLSEREHISHLIQAVLDDATDPWGVKVERVEVKDIRLPEQLMRAMAAEAEATREAKAKIIAAEGEQRASRALMEAALVIGQAPAALQLRYLQTLNSIAAEHNSTIIFPLPIDLIRHFMGSNSDDNVGTPASTLPRKAPVESPSTDGWDTK